MRQQLPRNAVVDLFCGAGGLSLGLQRAGLSIAVGSDIDPVCQHPYTKNIAADFALRDVRDLPTSELRNWFGNAHVSVLAACAPCQPFSGYVVGRYEVGERYKLLFEVSRLVAGTLPDIVTIENVPRLAFAPIWNEFLQKLRKHGYFCEWSTLDASEFGVPQRRRRLVLIASRLGNPSLPKPSRKTVVVREAIGSLPPLSAGAVHPHDPLHRCRGLTEKNLKRIRASRPGGTWRDWNKSLRAECHQTETGETYPSVYGRMSWDKPSPTITTQFYGFGNGRFGHPEQDRALSIREAAILQGFPVDYEFAPKSIELSFNTYGRLIGNAVPVGLAEAIGTAIVDHIQATGVATSRKSSLIKNRSTARRTAST